MFEPIAFTSTEVRLLPWIEFHLEPCKVRTGSFHHNVFASHVSLICPVPHGQPVYYQVVRFFVNVVHPHVVSTARCGVLEIYHRPCFGCAQVDRVPRYSTILNGPTLQGWHGMHPYRVLNNGPVSVLA